MSQIQTSKSGQTGVPKAARVAALASDNATLVKAGKTNVYGWTINNSTATIQYFKFYDKATAPVVGTDVPKFTVIVPANGVTYVSFPLGIHFALGLGYGIVTGAADTSTTATAVNSLHGAVLYT